jgi:acyl dehydratase
MALRSSQLSVGQAHQEVVVENLTRTQIVMYAGASGDFHPFHSDERYAKAMQLSGVFAHGMLTMGLTGKALTNFVGDGRLREYSARFVAQVWPGDTLIARIEVKALREEKGTHFADLEITTRNQKGEAVLSGAATARLDP